MRTNVRFGRNLDARIRDEIGLLEFGHFLRTLSSEDFRPLDTYRSFTQTYDRLQRLSPQRVGYEIYEV